MAMIFSPPFPPLSFFSELSINACVRISVEGETNHVQKSHTLEGRSLSLKLKTSAFEIKTRSVTLPRYISSHQDIVHYSQPLLEAELPICIRLLGIRVSSLRKVELPKKNDEYVCAFTVMLCYSSDSSPCHKSNILFYIHIFLLKILLI